MPYAFPPDVQEMIASHLATGAYATTDDVLRTALKTLDELDEDVQATQAAIDAWQNGDAGVPLQEAFRKVRESGTR